MFAPDFKARLPAAWMTGPSAIGFGIKTPEDAKAMSVIGNAIVVGSAIVQTVADNQNAKDLSALVTKQVSGLSGALKK